MISNNQSICWKKIFYYCSQLWVFSLSFFFWNLSMHTSSSSQYKCTIFFSVLRIETVGASMFRLNIESTYIAPLVDPLCEMVRVCHFHSFFWPTVINFVCLLWSLCCCFSFFNDILGHQIHRHPRIQRVSGVSRWFVSCFDARNQIRQGYLCLVMMYAWITCWLNLYSSPSWSYFQRF